MAKTWQEFMILALLQARTSSSRLPGKVLLELHGKPMILRQIERINRSSLIDELIVVTSKDSSDDQLTELLVQNQVNVRRGPLNDVLERFRMVIDEFRPSIIVRLTADCPLTDFKVIDHVISAHISGNSDYTSNVLEPTYPDGLDVECFSFEAFQRLISEPRTDPEKEHVTLGFYSHPEKYGLNSVTQSTNISNLRWTVDVMEDLVFVRQIYGLLYDQEPDFGQVEILELLKLRPNISRTDNEVARNSGMIEEEI